MAQFTDSAGTILISGSTDTEGNTIINYTVPSGFRFLLKEVNASLSKSNSEHVSELIINGNTVDYLTPVNPKDNYDGIIIQPETTIELKNIKLQTGSSVYAKIEGLLAEIDPFP
jgi:hypothetical protein